jgi:hypothetical protein
VAELTGVAVVSSSEEARNARPAGDRGGNRLGDGAAATCTVRVCGGRACGGTLIVVAGAVQCLACNRRRAGICAECPRPVFGTPGKALRCLAHLIAQRRRAALKYRHGHLEARRTVDRERKREQLRQARGGAPPMPAREKGLRAVAARNANLTPERRREIARHAITVRWARAKAAA